LIHWRYYHVKEISTHSGCRCPHIGCDAIGNAKRCNCIRITGYHPNDTTTNDTTANDTTPNDATTNDATANDTTPHNATAYHTTNN
jgi:hypothetical protein